MKNARLVRAKKTNAPMTAPTMTLAFRACFFSAAIGDAAGSYAIVDTVPSEESLLLLSSDVHGMKLNSWSCIAWYDATVRLSVYSSHCSASVA